MNRRGFLAALIALPAYKAGPTAQRRALIVPGRQALNIAAQVYAVIEHQGNGVWAIKEHGVR